MTQNLVLSLGAQRNEDYGPESWRMTDRDTGAALDITGWAFQFRIGVASGGPGLDLAVGETPTSNGSYTRVSTPPSDGAFELYIAKEDIAALPGRPADINILAFNLIAVDSSGFDHAWVVGNFTVKPGV